MSAALIRLAERVLQDYDVDAREVSLIHAAESKAIWRIKSRAGTLGLKRFKYDKDKMLFAIQAQKYLRDRGGPVPGIRPTRQGALYAEHQGQIFTLYDWAEGRKPSFAQSSDLRQAVRLLARLHAASAGFRPPIPCRESSKLGKWPDQYRAMENHLLQWRTASVDRKLASLLKPHWGDLIRIAGQARQELRESGYEDIVRKESPMLCHQDFSEGNVLFQGNGGTILDLDSVTYDLPARDLRKLILKRMQVKGGWDSKLFGSIMRWYTEVHPLGDEQMRMLLVDLRFPHLFHETAKNPYLNGSAVPDSKLLEAIRIERAKETALADWQPQA